MKKILLLTLIYTTIYATSDMKQLYLKNACNSCHGIYAEGMGATPRLQGVREAVLLERLQNLKKGKTRTPFGTVMISFAQGLSDSEIKQMAKYLSTLKTVVDENRYEQEYDLSGDGGS